MMRDPYKMLGVKKDAGADEIKAAWRSLAKTVHPDHNIGDPTATERFAEIGRAYETLKDPQKRSRYDQVAQMAETKAQSREQTIMQQRQAAREAEERAKAARANAEKVMEELARANARKAQAAAATNPQAAGASTSESPEDMVERIFGTKAARTAPSQAATDASAAEPEKQRETNSAAIGESYVEEEQLATGTGSSAIRSPFGILGSIVRRITGVPDKPPEKTPEIAAEATVTLDDMLKGQWITVPLTEGREARFQATTDISNGQVLHLKNQGLKLPGMLRGDVAITVHLSTDSRFTLDGFDVRTTLPVTIENAVLGYETEVEGLNGQVRLTVPAWSGSDQLIRISGEGLPDGQGGKGDLVVELRLMLWDKPDDKVTDLMRSMREGFFL